MLMYVAHFFLVMAVFIMSDNETECSVGQVCRYMQVVCHF
jgi:hypothetical protein